MMRYFMRITLTILTIVISVAYPMCNKMPLVRWILPMSMR